MLVSAILISLVAAVSSLSLARDEAASDTVKNVVALALYDSKCFYPTPDPKFNLKEYLGKWYQVAGMPFGPSMGARCITAEYSLNPDGTVKVLNKGIAPSNHPINITGIAAPAPKEYGAAGAFKVNFPGFPATPCAGPNYVVQAYYKDHAIVQTQNWSVLYILSREQHPAPASLDAWINHAVALGSDPKAISKFEQ